MEKTNQTTSHREAQDDIIELGVASVETKGPSGPGETNGEEVGAGISVE